MELLLPAPGVQAAHNMIARACRISTGSRVVLVLTLILSAHSVAALRDEVIAIDGQDYHLEISGRAAPTIVFEAGLGNDEV